MAPNPAACSKLHTEASADVISSAAAVFGALDLLEEMATDGPTRLSTNQARSSAEAALTGLGLTRDDLGGPSYDAQHWAGSETGRPLDDAIDQLAGEYPARGKLLQFRPKPPSGQA